MSRPRPAAPCAAAWRAAAGAPLVAAGCLAGWAEERLPPSFVPVALGAGRAERRRQRGMQRQLERPSAEQQAMRRKILDGAGLERLPRGGEAAERLQVVGYAG